MVVIATLEVVGARFIGVFVTLCHGHLRKRRTALFKFYGCYRYFGGSWGKIYWRSFLFLEESLCKPEKPCREVGIKKQRGLQNTLIHVLFSQIRRLYIQESNFF